MKFILASKSPRRKNILNKINLNFIIHPSNFNENSIPIDNNNPKQYCKMLSIKKGENVAKKFPKDYIIGADTIVYHNNQILGKPENSLIAKQQLNLLSNTKHMVYTGVTLINKQNNFKKSFVEETAVFFNKLNSKDVEFYIKKYKPYDKAGSYGIQDWSGIFIKKINGCFYNVVGFPLSKFHKLFYKELNI